MRVLLAAVLVLIIAPVAQARVVRAENVLPPGQSGYVSLSGLLNGTGSPHLNDQTSLFTSFERKPFDFGQPAEDTETPFAGVTITRDAYGVPSVTGDTELNAWKGAGYAIAQDRMFQLDAFRAATQGELADIQGESALGDDLIARRDFYTAAEREQQFDKLPPQFKARIEAYRDGINAWIDHLRSTPSDLPGEYPATGTELTDWTVDDTLSVGIFLARTVPSSDGAELRNLAAVQRSPAGGRILDRLLPLSLKGQRSTIPESEGRFPQGSALSPAAARSARKRSLRFAGGLPAVEETRRAELPPGRLGRVGGSYMFAVRGKDGGGVLFNGPQLGYSIPELFVELEVHAPGLDVRGVTAAGVPVIAIGHNGDVAWGITSGLSDDDDLYAEKLVPGEPEKYVFKGEVRDMECREETFAFSSPITDPAGGSGTRSERICRTVHGPVQVRADGVAYARRYAIWGREIETLEGLAAVNEADDIRDVQRAVRRLTWNENLMALDSKGNIGYWHPGLIQRRPAKWDQRLPLPGDGRAEWPGLVPRSKLPSVVNPDQGYLVNWNNIPSQGWTTGDGEASERQTGPLHRVGWLDRQVRPLRGRPTFARAELAVRRAGTFAQQRPLSSGLLRRVSRGASGPAGTVLRVLRSWNGDYDTTDGAGTVDPGVATWEEFKERAAARATAPFGAEAARLFGERPGRSHVFDITSNEAFALRTLSTRQLRSVAAVTFRALQREFGSPTPAQWRTPRAMYDVGAQGAATPPELPFYDRGTYEQIVELAP